MPKSCPYIYIYVIYIYICVSCLDDLCLVRLCRCLCLPRYVLSSLFALFTTGVWFLNFTSGIRFLNFNSGIWFLNFTSGIWFDFVWFLVWSLVRIETGCTWWSVCVYCPCQRLVHLHTSCLNELRLVDVSSNKWFVPCSGLRVYIYIYILCLVLSNKYIYNKYIYVMSCLVEIMSVLSVSCLNDSRLVLV